MKKAIITPLPPLSGSPAARLAQLRDRLAAAAARGNHPAPALIAVSKMQSAATIRPWLEAGQRRFGENRVQEAQAKWPALKADYPDAELHLIGRLQSNKAADAVALFDAIHSVDRPSLISAIAAAQAATGRTLMLFAQVNLGDEAQKGGVAPADLPALLATARAAGLGIGGLMCIPPADKDPAIYFALLARLAKDNSLPRLSMGMSDDYDIAATLGATHVRIGTALFLADL